MKEKVQRFGRALSGMVMPNIGAFIAWGIITALFIPKGWIPNENFAKLVDPMVKYLLPLLIGYSGGKAIADHRGGVVGAITTMGVIVGAGDMPMFLGAMIAGPLGGFIIKKFDKLVEGKIPAGFEMLVNNFSAGIIGAILVLIAYMGITPVCNTINNAMGVGVGFFVNAGLLPLASIFIEPAKVLFLNNAINHGVLGPLGIEQAAETGKSIFYMLESNPGPGLGILLAYCFAGKGSAKSSASGAAIIHFLGGIHEIYFPYILMNPILIIAAIAGGASGVFTFSILDAGLVATASPGSILALLGMTPKGHFLGTISGIAVATIVSFIVAVLLLKFFDRGEDLETAQQKSKDMKVSSKSSQTVQNTNSTVAVKKIVFACDAGMGSSAMGATVLKKKLKAAGLNIEVTHASVQEIPKDAQIIVTHTELKERAAKSNPDARLVPITNFMNAPEYDELVDELSGKSLANK